jgi:hypothetical protein
MDNNERVVAIMKGLQQAAADRGWCLIEGGVGAGKSHGLHEALYQLGWESVWKGPEDLAAEAGTFAADPRETLVFDGLVEEWAPDRSDPVPVEAWTRLYAAIEVATERARQGLLTVVCADTRGHAEHIDRDSLVGCVAVDL